MIVLCPKAFSSTGSTLERDFLQFYLSRCGKKATIADATWETFRNEIMIKSTNKNSAKSWIASYRGFVEPENTQIGKDYQELPPQKSHDKEHLVTVTKDLVNRNGENISLFITQEPELYKELKDKVKIMTLEEFYVDSTSSDDKRKHLIDFWERIQAEKWE